MIFDSRDEEGRMVIALCEERDRLKARVAELESSDALAIRAEERLESENEERTINAVVGYLRHLAGGYALVRSIKSNGARDALYAVASKLEKDYRSCLGSRLMRR